LRYDFAMALSKQLTLRLPTYLKRELEGYARLTGQSRSAVIREAIAVHGPWQRNALPELATLDVDNDQ
jgi:predicted transcriptional regulator